MSSSPKRSNPASFSHIDEATTEVKANIIEKVSAYHNTENNTISNDTREIIAEFDSTWKRSTRDSDLSKSKELLELYLKPKQLLGWRHRLFTWRHHRDTAEQCLKQESADKMLELLLSATATVDSTQQSHFLAVAIVLCLERYNKKPVIDGFHHTCGT